MQPLLSPACDLDHFSVQSLTHLDARVTQQDRPVQVDPDQRPRLHHREGSHGRRELDWDNRQSPLDPLMEDSHMDMILGRTGEWGSLKCRGLSGSINRYQFRGPSGQCPRNKMFPIVSVNRSLLAALNRSTSALLSPYFSSQRSKHSASAPAPNSRPSPTCTSSPSADRLTLRTSVGSFPRAFATWSMIVSITIWKSTGISGSFPALV